MDWRDQPRVLPGELLLQVLRVGVCGTDLQILHGDRDDVAAILGHEGVGRIIQGETATTDVQEESAPFRVFNPVDPSDQDNILGHSYNGIFCESICLPIRSVVPADPRLSADLGPLVEPLATVIYAWQLISLRGRPREIGIWGGGSTAVLMALVSQMNGARVHVFHRRRDRLAWLSGIEGLSAVEFHCAPSQSRNRLSFPQLDAAVLCVPRAGAMIAFEQAMSLVREDGCIDLFGGFAPGDRSAIMPHVDLGLIRRGNVSGEVMLGCLAATPKNRGIIWLTGHRGSSRAQLETSQGILIEHAARFGSIISDVISLELAADFIPQMINETREEHLKVVIDLTMVGLRREPDIGFTLANVAS